jgi:uncharacterized protein YjbJ (UPF0337 family)
MAKSAKRDRSEGTLDKMTGKVLEVLGKVTGRPTTKAKGKAALGRGHARTAKGRAKTRAGRR